MVMASLVLRSLVWVVAGVVVVIAGMWVFQRRLIYLPTQGVPPVGDLAGGWQEVAFDTADGLTLQGFYVPPQPNEPVVVVFNGNAGNRSDRLPLGNGLAGAGLGVMLVDYRGYGGNPGHPTETRSGSRRPGCTEMGTGQRIGPPDCVFRGVARSSGGHRTGGLPIT